ncbi:unnamed protein product [Zymoseptoria tritici ST99CH_1E4]|uniref:Uncharacterized protein n=1 Tax=Zymoseptoria tritici ST99CH_1E4 TaxID=1276532 RepID=A0A2H1GHB5_ZYMTR|nr:unnamed protein product [Zymoseptoria tritici ST99CH_1E4]
MKYSLLKPESQAMEERGHDEQEPSHDPWKQHFTILNIVLFFFSASLLLLAVRIEDARMPRDDLGYQRLYSPIWSAVEYQKKVFYADVEANKKYVGQPRPELDEAWANITEGHLILLNETGVRALGQSLDEAVSLEGKYFALPEYYHQMHCLDIIRRSFWREHYSDFKVFQFSEEAIMGHIDHCLDLLRQMIMCTADVGLIIYYWEGADREPQAKFATEHMCRNLDRINDWVLEHKWEDEVTFDPLDPHMMLSHRN